MSFFESLKSLFPKSKAFDLTHESNFKKFVRGLAVLPEDIQKGSEQVYFDLFPETTRALAEWENQFQVLFADEQYGTTRPEILKSLWQSNAGGQSITYLEGLLKNISKDIILVENNPVKNPRDSNAVFACMCGQKHSVCGNERMNCGFKVGDSTFEPTIIKNGKESSYDIPPVYDYWRNYFFVCGGVVRNSRKEIIYCQKLKIDSKWKAYIEYLILKIKPVQVGAVLFIEWVENLGNMRIKK